MLFYFSGFTLLLAIYCANCVSFVPIIARNVIKKKQTLQLVCRICISMDDAVILDVDESTTESPHLDDLLFILPDVVSTLKSVLKKQLSAYGDTVIR